MQFHASHVLGLPQRHALCLAIEGGMSLKAAAAAFNVSPAAAHRWWHRWRSAGDGERRSLGCLHDRSSRPRRSPRRLSAAEEEPILRARRETGLGPGRLAGIVRRARSTIWKVLHRHGPSRRPRGERQGHRRYEWSRPGALLHMDVKRLARFSRAGHALTGDRRRSRLWSDRNLAVGYDHLHVVVDDHSRLAYVELHPREDADSNARTLERAAAWFAQLGLSPPEAVMTDNAFVYVHGRRFKRALARIGARHITTPPYTPRWNGKAERFIQTLQTEWAYAHRWENSQRRARALSSFMRYYNRRRPHGSLGDRPPISRVHNVHGQDS
jgi:transposase InsO family protein